MYHVSGFRRGGPGFSMNFFYILAALWLESRRPVAWVRKCGAGFDAWAGAVRHWLDAGHLFSQGAPAWFLAILPLLACAGLLTYLLALLNLDGLFDMLVLMLLMNFRSGLDPLVTLRRDVHPASAHSPAESQARIAEGIEQAIITFHGRTLAVLLWYCLLPGPLGALLYAAAHRLADSWGRPGTAFGRFSVKVFSWLDWIPVRLTAFTFAVVGNFEDALYCWRMQGARDNRRQILASAAGALGIRLEGEGMSGNESVELGVGELPEADHLRSVEGLIWRSLVLWMLVIGLMTLARRVGHQ